LWNFFVPHNRKKPTLKKPEVVNIFIAISAVSIYVAAQLPILAHLKMGLAQLTIGSWVAHLKMGLAQLTMTPSPS